MSETKFAIGINSGLFPPLVVVIDEKDYVVEIGYAALTNILKLETAVKGGTIEAMASMYEEVELMTKCPREILDKIDIREIRELILYVANHIFRSEKNTVGVEKNVSGPGENI